MTAAPTTTRAALHRRRANPTLVTTVLALTGTIVALQQTLMVPLLPEFPTLLHTTAEDASWLVTATLLTSAVATPVVSRLADMHGKRRMMLVCLVLQILGSVLGALGGTLAVVVAGRALQGFAAALIPVGISIMRDELPRERVGGAVALMSATLGIGSAAGLPLAGLISAQTSWHALFWVSAAMAAAMLVAIPLVVPESTLRTPGSFDGVGAVLLSLALVAFLLPVTKGSHWGWTSETTLVLAVASVVLLAIWVPWELRTRTPMVDLRTAARRPVLLTNLASVLVGFSMYGNMLSTTQLLQLPERTGFGFGLDVLQAGLAMVPGGLMMVLLSPASAAITRRWGGRTTLVTGALVLAGGYVLRVFLVDHLWQIVLGAMLVSAGTAIAYAAMPTLIMGAVPITETASANGLNSLLRAVGTSSASAVVAMILTTTVSRVGGVALPTLDAFKHIFWVCALAALVSALVAAFLPSARPSPVSSRGRARAEDEDEIVVAGRVTATGVRPVRSAVVTVIDLDGDQVDWARVEPDGSYAIVLPGPGDYVTVTAADGWEPHSEVVHVSGTHAQDIDLGDRLQLAGQVTADGLPVPGALVTMTALTGQVSGATRAGADGGYVLPLSTHGRHVVTAADPSTGRTGSVGVTLTGVERRVDLDLGPAPRHPQPDQQPTDQHAAAELAARATT
ncbi:MFS transporter [Arsenicicoccus bolidensis]|uniref:MFS transporter n=1 Tax=Arsenicicoccus bolidensis TaxID=229480 RepID=UPI00040D3F8E|nr:MFS transporter [Arsenicicoccus bolidensis]